jgi:hypothetical protein
MWGDWRSYDNKYEKTAIALIMAMLAMAMWRTGVPTVIDLSHTSIHKDFAHLLIGAAIMFGLLTKDLGVLGIVGAVSVYELILATVFTKWR